MKIRVSEEKGVIVVRFAGRLDSTSAPEAQGKIMPLIKNGCLMVLEMSECDYISSAGLRLLLMIAKLLSTKGGKCVLSGVCEDIRDVMEMTGFSRIFEYYTNLPEAVSSLRGN